MLLEVKRVAFSRK